MNIIYRYSFSEILEIIQQQVYLTKGCYLTIQEQEILKGTWNNLYYQEIAESLYLSNGYVRIIASALWKTLSSVFGENITKANFYYTINNILQLDNTDNNNDHRNQYPKEHILIVDDSLEIIQLISRFLNKNGYRVSAFMNGNDALMFLKNQSINLIILDIFMPDINGYEIYEQVKSSVNLNHIPIIFTSHLNDSESKVKSFNLGANDYITKPFNLQELLLRVAYHISCHKRELAKIREIEECKKTIEILLAEVSNNKKGNQE